MQSWYIPRAALLLYLGDYTLESSLGVWMVAGLYAPPRSDGRWVVPRPLQGIISNSGHFARG